MITRRKLLKLVTVSTGVAVLPRVVHAMPAPEKKLAAGFTYCLNMASIREHKLGFIKELELATAAGFSSVEIWVDTLQAYLANGGTLKEAKSRLDSLGVTIENAIGFAEWIVDDNTKRSSSLEQMKREMDMLAQLGCKRTAAPPMGATTGQAIDLKIITERFRAVQQLGDQAGVVPQLEMWGFSKNLTRVSDVMYVALESGHANAKVLLDMFHLYKGGSSIDTLHLINPAALDIFHINDYPANMPAATITDADRIYPGDGVAPLKAVLKTLQKPVNPLVISFEVFNKNYYSQDALLVAKTALAKMKKLTADI